MGIAFSGGIRTSRAFSGEIGTPAAFSGSIRTPRAFSGDNRLSHGLSGKIGTLRGSKLAKCRPTTPQVSKCCPRTHRMSKCRPTTTQRPRIARQHHRHRSRANLKRDRGTDVHASFGNFFFAHRQTPRHQRSKTPGLHEGIMRLPVPDQINIPITGTNASQALGALEDCPPPIDILELIRRKQERDREALTLHRIGQDPNAHLVAQPFNQIKTDSR